MVKQVIVLNMAVPMSIGRLAAQGAHASILAILNQGSWNKNTFTIQDASSELKYWMKESFTKVFVKAWGFDSLFKLNAKATALGISSVYMEEDGYTTALAIGPHLSSKIDEITKDLPLL